MENERGSIPLNPQKIKDNFYLRSHIDTIIRKLQAFQTYRKIGKGQIIRTSYFIDGIINQHTGGELMKIKYDSYKNIRVGSGPKKYPMIEVTGTQIGGKFDGEERSTRFFPSEKDMLDVIKNATKGDVLDITMTKNGNFLNPTAIVNETSNGTAEPINEIPEVVSLKNSVNNPHSTIKPDEMLDINIRSAAVNVASKITGDGNVDILLANAQEIANYISGKNVDVKLPEPIDDINGDSIDEVEVE